MLKHNIMFKFMLIFIPSILAVYVGMFLFLQKYMYDKSIGSVRKLSIEAQTYTMNNIEKEGKIEDFYANANLIASYLSSTFDMRVQIYRNPNELIADTKKEALPLMDSDIEESFAGKKAYLIKKGTTYPMLLFSCPIYYQDRVIGVERFIIGMKKEADLLIKLNLTFSVLFLLVVLISIFFINKTAQSISQPIENLREMSNRMAKGNYNKIINKYKHMEIQQLANDFNLLAEAIQFHIGELESEKKRQKDFVDQITHELKTPITSILGYAEIIPKLDDPLKIEESLSYISKEGKRLQKLVEEILYSNQNNHNCFIIKPSIMDLADLIRDCLRIMNVKFNQYHISVHNEVDKCSILADYDKTKQVLLNIFENIVKYSDALHIYINIMNADDKNITVMIKDDGIGIGKNVLSAWDNRTNHHTKRMPSSAGSGYGLLICDQIMKAQGGSISISSRDSEGASVFLTWLTPSQISKMKAI
ncbi:HAMP domain-containing sensor histidine kinase [Heyndrickxia coagulans]|uniref:sensor histidine kinase n=2 Tax=Bacillota TaxID=1239 RepID=UPI003D1F67A6